MKHYKRTPSDPAWLVNAADFHGHLGPWLTLGAMIGRDALQRMDTSGHWNIEVVCFIPPEKQRLPFTCIVDGLQVASGATMGKRNIRIDWSTEIVHETQPVVYVIQRVEDDRPHSGLVYRINKRLEAILEDVSPDRLEEISRQIARQKVEDLFTIQPISKSDFMAMGRQAIGG